MTDETFEIIIPEEWVPPYETVTHEISVTSLPEFTQEISSSKVASEWSVVIIALLGFYIAYQQQRINRLRLKHEQFDRLHEIHQAFNGYITNLMNNAKYGLKIDINSLTNFLAKKTSISYLFLIYLIAIFSNV